jgi:hypothetical protein
MGNSNCQILETGLWEWSGEKEGVEKSCFAPSKFGGGPGPVALWSTGQAARPISGRRHPQPCPESSPSRTVQRITLRLRAKEGGLQSSIYDLVSSDPDLAMAQKQSNDLAVRRDITGSLIETP